MSENKQEKIISMFNDIAPTYDTANRVLSFGIDKNWRKIACKKALEVNPNPETIVDVACGTGDMCEYWTKFSSAKVIGVDPAINMLKVAEEKGLNVDFVEAEATNLPFKNESIDILSISYGFRNVMEKELALQEFKRVLKPNGLVVILEFTKLPKKSIVGKIRDTYMKNILPIVGGFLSKNKEAYQYLPDSIDNFLTKDDLSTLLKEQGFEMIEVKGHSFEISTMFIAKKIKGNN